MTIFRTAQEADLRPAYEVFYQNELLANPELPPIGPTPPALQHIHQTGTIHIAEQDRKVLAYVGAVTRGDITFLTLLANETMDGNGPV
jgi:hypothetical protein